MKGLYKIWGYVLATAFVIVAGVAVWMWWSGRKGAAQEEKIEAAPAKVVDLRTIAELCSMDIYREETLLDTINGKVIFAIWKLKGEILFDMEGLPAQLASAAGDTLRLRLPKERVELLESTSPGAWRVVDTYSLRFLGNDRLTPEEENRVKSKALARVRKCLYTDGTVKRARSEAAASLSRLLTPLSGSPVVIEP